MRNFTLFLLLAALPLLSRAQYPVVTIADIQTVDAMSLANCEDESPLLDDTVTTRGVVIMNGGLAYSAFGRQIWIQDGPGEWDAIDVRFGGNTATTPDDMQLLLAGDSIEVTGVIERFGGETQINPLSVTLIDAGKEVQYAPNFDIGLLNGSGLVQRQETGEAWEGQYIEIVNVTVSALGNTFANNRQNFSVQDQSGNEIQISDRFPAGRSTNSDGNNANEDVPGELVIPAVGTTFDTIRGVILHTYPSGCAASGNLSFGYELHPFSSDDIVIGASAPQISAMSRNPLTPNETQDVNVSAFIEDPDGTVVSATVHYAVGLSNNAYLTAPMTDNGSGTYTGTIPNTAYSNDQYVKYYVSATDDSSLTSSFPGQAANDPIIFAVRADGTTIYDVQFTPNGDGNSLYEGLDVTVEGVVTASAQPGDLGYVYIQQEGQTEWAGLPLIQSADLNTLARGDRVRVTGEIRESFGLTLMAVNSVTELASGVAMPAPVVVNPDTFTNPSDFNERYEGMLVTLQRDGGSIYVVDDNADDNGGGTSNFAEYRVGASLLSDVTGCRVLAGRQNNNAFSSLNFSYINDSTWIFNAGEIDTADVPVCIVTPGDSMSLLTGVMTYSFSNYKLLPRNNDDVRNYDGACGLGSVSIEDVAETYEVSLYPNPATSRLYVELNTTLSEAVQIEVLDMVGRQVAAQNVRIPQGVHAIDLQNLTEGVYIVRLSAGEQLIHAEKLVLTR